MTLNRPDLSGLPPSVQAYITALEAELVSLRSPRPRPRAADAEDAALGAEPAQPFEPLTTFQVITATAGGLIKRTPRHLYARQRRGGMGIFDLDAPESDPPAILSIADVTQTLILVTSQGRAFPLPVASLAEAPVRARGEALRGRFPLQPDERLALVIPDMGAGYLTLVTRRGQVRRWRYNVFGRSLQGGTLLYEVREGGAPAAACWSNATDELFIVTAKGNAIRFTENQVPVRGCLGMRVDPDDAVVGVASLREDGGVFLLGDDGKGTIRLMAGFARNKEPGSGGKQAMKADRLVGAVGAGAGDDLFAISRLGKIIRFAADETPPKEGVVQGVNCMELRGDATVAVTGCRNG